MTTYKVIEIGQNPGEEKKVRKTLYQGPSKAEATAAYNQPQSLLFSHKRFYEGRRRRYAYEF